MNKPLGNIFAALAAVALLQGCVQFSDTINRPQVSTLPADGSDMVLQNEIAGNTYTPIETASARTTETSVSRSNGLHPHIAYIYQKLCPAVLAYCSDCVCTVAEVAHVVYQDKDVAVVTTEKIDGPFNGAVGYHYLVLDLKGKLGDVIFEKVGQEPKVTRKGKQLIFSFSEPNYDGNEGREWVRSKKVFNLGKKNKTRHICDIFECVN